MSVLFATSYAGACKVMVSSVEAENSSTWFDAVYSDAGMTTAGSTSTIQLQTPDFATELVEGFMHACYTCSTTTSYKANEFIGFYNSVRGGWDVVVFITFASNANTVTFRYWNGTTMVDAGVSAAFTTAGIMSYDFYFNKATGTLTFWQNETILITVTGLDLSNINVNCARWRAGNSYLGNGTYSQLLVAEESTVGARVFTPNLSAGAVNTLLSGTFSDVAVDAIRLPNTFVTADTDGQLATFAVEDLVSSFDVMAVCINTRTKRGVAGPANVEMIARVGGANYASGENALTLGVNPINHVFENNPATGLAWTVADVNAAEFGLRAKT